MPKKGRRSGQDEALGADPGGLGGDEDYDWIRSLGEGRSSASAGSSPATSATASTALQSAARTVTPRSARPAAARPAAPTRQFGRDADQPPDGDTDPGGGPVGRGRAGTERGLGGRLAAGRRAEPPQPYEPPSYDPPPYDPQPYEPPSYEPGTGRTGGTGPLPAARRTGRAEPGGAADQRDGYGPVQPSRTPSGTGPRPASGPAGLRRAVKVRQGRTTDLLFNPAAEDYGQPLYAPGDDYGQRAGDVGSSLAGPARTQDRQQEDRFTSPQRRLDTAEFAKPLYPALDSGPATDARGRAARSRQATPAPPGADRTGPQRRIEGLSGADPRTTGPQRRVDDLGAADPRTTGPQRPVDGLSRPDPLTDNGIGVLWASEPAAAPAGVAPEAAITKSPARRTGTGPFDDALAESADLPGTAPRGKPARKPRKGTKKAEGKPKPVRSRPRSGRRKRATVLIGGLVIIAVLAAVGYVKLMPRTSHTVSAPAALGSFAKQQANATAKNLRHRIVTAAAGDVKNVVAAVYQQNKGPGTSKGPQIVVFIGGNLTGNASASDLISAYMTRLHGSFTTSPGTLGGQAACAPGANGGPSECAWADGDTFGVVVSATLSATGLADEMRQMRPLVEHVAR